MTDPNWIECDVCGAKYRSTTLFGTPVNPNPPCPGESIGNKGLVTKVKQTTVASASDKQWAERYLKHYPETDPATAEAEVKQSGTS